MTPVYNVHKDIEYCGEGVLTYKFKLIIELWKCKPYMLACIRLWRVATIPLYSNYAVWDRA